MSADGGRNTEWLSFVQRLGQLTGTPAAEIGPGAAFMETLSLDSLALAQLVVELRETYETGEREIQLDGRNWQTVTVGQVFEDFTGARAPAGPPLTDPSA